VNNKWIAKCHFAGATSLHCSGFHGGYGNVRAAIALEGDPARRLSIPANTRGMHDGAV
jgi:hypothetical protein